MLIFCYVYVICTEVATRERNGWYASLCSNECVLLKSGASAGSALIRRLRIYLSSSTHISLSSKNRKNILAVEECELQGFKIEKKKKKRKECKCYLNTYVIKFKLDITAQYNGCVLHDTTS